MNEERLEHLLDCYFDGALQPGEQRELESLLLSWPQARTLFWKRARFHAMLRRRGRELWGRRLATENVPAAEPVVPRWRAVWTRLVHTLRPAGWWAAAGLAAVLVLLLAHPWSASKAVPDAGATASPLLASEFVEPALPGADSHHQGVATILRAVDVKWTGKKRQPGNVLGPGWLRFQSGLVEIQFHRGARVVLEGPAEFELITDMQARCLRGKISAEVPPPAIGFEILSPNVRVVDRGTAFGLDVEGDGPAEVHVFSGRVDFATTRPPETPRELRQGNAVRVEANGTVSAIPSGEQAFTTAEFVERKAASTMAVRFAAWREQAEALRHDPALLVQYTLEGDSLDSRKLLNLAPAASPESHGTVIGCTATEGRWPGKHALDFKQIGDRIRFSLPTEYQALTCLAWIRLDAMDRPYTALLMSGNATIGELQWQLRGSGALNFGKRKEAGWGFGKLYNVETRPALSPSRCGSWMQVAFVYDAHARTVAHYLDGQRVLTGPMDATIPLRTQSLEIGNWTPISGAPVEPIRAFNGRLDEFLMFARALRPEEIQQLWETGRPL